MTRPEAGAGRRDADVPARSRAKGLAITAAGVMALSPESLVIRLLSVDRWTILLWRGVLLALGLLVVFWLGWARGRLRRELAAAGGAGVVAAVLFAGDNVLFVTAVTTTSVANTLLILSAAPVFSAVLSRVVLGEPVPRRTWPAIAAVISGVALILSGSLAAGRPLGDLAALGAGLCLAGTFVVIRRSRAVNLMPAMAGGALLAALVALPLAAPASPRGGDVVLLLVTGLGMLPLAFGLITAGPRYLRAQEVSLLMLLETVFGPLWVWLVLREVPHPRTLVGGALVVAALLAYFSVGTEAGRSSRRRVAAVEEPPGTGLS